MKIDRPGVKNVTETYRAGGVRTGINQQTNKNMQAAAPADVLAVSGKAQQVHSLRSKLRDVPEVRMDLVNRIKQQIERGDYSVKPEDVAEKMLKAKVLD